MIILVATVVNYLGIGVLFALMSLEEKAPMWVAVVTALFWPGVLSSAVALIVLDKKE